jgi:hypothetical protein
MVQFVSDRSMDMCLEASPDESRSNVRLMVLRLFSLMGDIRDGALDEDVIVLLLLLLLQLGVLDLFELQLLQLLQLFM